ncbi:MAG TPA: ArsC/Spx/MgsR family protein [Anaeromyxobacter sp.]
MSGEWVLWFDARCSASKRALELLRERGVEPVLRRFLEEPPTPEELAALVAKLGVAAHAVARRDADEYQALRLSDRTPDDELLGALAQHPRILERPIVVAGGRAVVARPPERVLELFEPAAAPRRVADNRG